MLNWFKNVITGSFSYWNTNCNKYVAEQYEKASAYPPAISALFRSAVSSGYLVVDAMLGPDHGVKRMFSVGVKEINHTQY
jgi:hypothetical protein